MHAASALRSFGRPIAARVSAMTAQTSSSSSSTTATQRAFSAASIRFGGHGHGPSEPLVGPGAPPGEVPTELNQSTGLERYEYLSRLEGKAPFDMAPLQMTHRGTPSNPMVVQSIEDVRYVGCTGYPAESHDTIWLRVTKTKEQGVDRCPECGCCYQLKEYERP